MSDCRLPLQLSQLLRLNEELERLYTLDVTSWRPCWWTGTIRFFSCGSSLPFLCKRCEQIFFCFVHQHGGNANHLYVQNLPSQNSFVIRLQNHSYDLTDSWLYALNKPINKGSRQKLIKVHYFAITGKKYVCEL